MKILRKESHNVRLIRQNVKKAKNFEIRKISRRLKQALDANATKEEARRYGDVEKIKEQLASVKSLQADSVIYIACLRSGLTKDAENLASFIKVVSESSSGPQKWAEDRILNAGCVRDVILMLKKKVEASQEGENGGSSAEAGEISEGPIVSLDMENERKRKADGTKQNSKKIRRDVIEKSEKPIQAKAEKLTNQKENGNASKQAKADVSKLNPVSVFDKGKGDKGVKQEKEVNDLSEDESGFFLDDEEDAPPLLGSSEGEISEDDDYTTDLKSAFRAAVGLKNTKGKNENKEVKVVKKKAKVKGKPRNRLGQRERRRLAEAKYGNHAKHVKKERNVKRGREDSQKVNGKPHLNVKQSQMKKSPLKSEKESPASLHPSWAAKAAQAKLLAVAPCGKKIKFED